MPQTHKMLSEAQSVAASWVSLKFSNPRLHGKEYVLSAEVRILNVLVSQHLLTFLQSAKQLERLLCRRFWALRTGQNSVPPPVVISGHLLQGFTRVWWTCKSVGGVETQGSKL